jgi:hypothetical protein
MAIQFKFSRIVYKTAQSREIGSNEPPRRVGVASAQVDCACSYSWSARPGAGIDGVLGGLLVTCPSCRSSESVGGQELGL